MYNSMSFGQSVFILLMCGLAILLVRYFSRKWSPTVSTYDPQTANLVAEHMTTLLTSLYNSVCIYKPVDAMSTWHIPIQRGQAWVYRAKAMCLPNALTDISTLKDFASLINSRAADVGIPIRVTNIYVQGSHFIYDVRVY